MMTKKERKMYSAKRSSRNREIIDAAKSGPCMDCGKLFPSVCMDFDHVRGIKWKSVGHMLMNSERALRSEIHKCELVCANCHRLRTHHRRIADRLRERK